MSRGKRFLAVLFVFILAFSFFSGDAGKNLFAGSDNMPDDNAQYIVTADGVSEGGSSADGIDYTRAMARKSQVYDASKSALIYDDVNQKKAKKRGYTVMVYMIGSNLESILGNATKDLEEMLGAGVDFEKVNLIVCTGGAQRWTGNVPCDQTSILDLSLPEESRIRAHTDGNADMGAPDMLSNFVNYCTAWYPADHFGLILWDHGGGPVWGYGSDELFDDDSLLLTEMDAAMAGTQFAGAQKLDFVGFDACLMASLENMAVWEKYADYFIGSSETEPGAGWDYSFLSICNDETDTEKIADRIIESYAGYYEKNKSETSNPDVTLSCVKLSEIAGVTKALGALAKDLSSSLEAGNYSEIQKIRADTKSFGNLGNDGDKGSVRYDLIDAEDFARQLENKFPDESTALKEAIAKAVTCSCSNVENSSGITLYYPYGNKEMYKAAAAELGNVISPQDYRIFINNIAGSWLSGQTRDWKIADAEEEGENYTFQLTDDELQNMSRAYYTVLKKDDNGDYMPVLEEVSVIPDKNGIVRVPKDPELICLKMDNDTDDNDTMFWGFRQVSEDRKRIVYRSHTTGLDKDAGFMSTGKSSVKFVDIALSFNKKSGALNILSVTSSNTDGTSSSKDSIDVDGYALIYLVEHAHFPEKRGDGSTPAYSEWNKSGLTHALFREISGNPVFFTANASELDDDFAVQMILEDTNGEAYGSDVIDLDTKDKPDFAAYDTPAGKISCSIYSDYASVTGYSGSDEEIEIPKEVNGKTVTKVESLDGENKTVKKVVFPDTVTDIDSQACEGMTGLEEVSLPKKLQAIGELMFDGCGSLKNITIPSGVKKIGMSAFLNCSMLKEITIPKACGYIGQGAFSGCEKLSGIKVEDGNTAYKNVGEAVLTYDGKRLVAFPQAAAGDVSVPDGVLTIGYGAFWGAYKLKSINLPDTLKTIEYAAFFNCAGLSDLNLPESLEKMDEQAFGLGSTIYQSKWNAIYPEKREQITIKIGNNLTKIGEGAFDAVLARNFTVDSKNPYYSEKDGALMNKAGDQLVSPATDGTGVLVIPDGTVSLNWNMLDFCQSFLKDKSSDIISITPEVYLPRSVTRFESADSYVYSSSVIFHCERDSAAWKYAVDNDIKHDAEAAGEREYTEKEEKTEKGSLTYQVYADYARLVKYSGEDTSLVIPEEIDGVPVTIIGDGTEGITDDFNETVKSIALPSGIQEIADRGLYYFEDVREMNLPESIKILGSRSLPAYCNLTEIPPAAEYLGERFAYSDITGELVLPSSLKDVDPGAFTGMRNVTAFAMNGKSDAYSTADGVLYSADGAELCVYPPAGDPDVIVAEGVKRIGDGVFRDSYSIKSVSLSSSVTEIGENAFDNSSLARVRLNEGVEKIGKAAFASCSNLETISFPDSLTEIGERAFGSCSFTSLEIPGSVETISSSAFSDNEELTDIIIEEGVKAIDDFAFDGCDKISSLSLPDSLYAIGQSAFGQSGIGEETGEPFTLHIGRNLTELSSWSPFGGLNITAYEVDEGNLSFKSVYGFLTDASGESLIFCPTGLSGTAVVPDGIRRIEEYSFSDCENVTDVVIPDSVEAFGGSSIFKWSYGEDDVRTSDVTIHCSAGSAAEKYAADNNIKCVTDS